MINPDAVEIETTHDQGKSSMLAEEAGYLEDAEAAWTIIAANDPRANPARSYQLIKGGSL